MKIISQIILCVALLSFSACSNNKTSTKVSIFETNWFINSEITNPRSAGEGLLMNTRMVNVTFEDRNRTDFDSQGNTDEFIAAIPEYVSFGLNAFTLNLQGGMPGYEGAVNSAFNSDGSLRPEYLNRVERVIRACDRNSAVVILGFYYQRQHKILDGEKAIRAGVVNAVQWIQEKGFTNVVVDVANEYGHSGYEGSIIQDPEGQASLVRLAKETAPELLVSTSGLGNGKIDPVVAEACDFLLPHWNGTKVEDIPARVEVLKQYGKPVVCNEDATDGDEAVAKMLATVNSGAGYGLMLEKVNQHDPFDFKGAADDPVYYEALSKVTGNH
jgi:hypothetical protein